eukprot:TRINITY_DN39990_c0_g1_i1.p1 TRINITY_DN39990_c0_g1~~TRINITY_DN39990_c0_g1_i1.p1  ORF type:complete len:323 (-),score=69.61 TRINITY_DN39990_c0_g1_i1:138-1106(-)
MASRSRGGSVFGDSVASKLLAASAHVRNSVRRDGIAGKSAKGDDCVVEITDLPSALPGDPSSDSWLAKAKVLVQQSFRRFGPIIEVKVPTSVARIRFSSAKGPSEVMRVAPRGYLELGQGEVRLRLPGAPEAVWQKFPPPRRPSAASAESAFESGGSAAQGGPAAKKRKLRPNERFATKTPAVHEDEVDESERFWEEQQQKRAEAAAAGTQPVPPQDAGCGASGSAGAQEFPIVPEEPERPKPAPLEAEASAEDRAVSAGEHAVEAAMATLLEQPFSQQRKALKSLRRQWHPDKHPDDVDVATRVFQFIQAHDAWLAHHGLA